MLGLQGGDGIGEHLPGAGQGEHHGGHRDDEPIQMAVHHVADLVSEDRFDLLIVHRFQQKIAQQDVTEARDETHDGGVAHLVLGFPEEDIVKT